VFALPGLKPAQGSNLAAADRDIALGDTLMIDHNAVYEDEIEGQDQELLDEASPLT
jgi:hypothetical protein